MTVLSDIITKAFRETNLIAVGSTPTTAQSTEALDLLNNVILTLADYQATRPMREIVLEGATVDTGSERIFLTSDLVEDYLPENTRLICDVTEAKTVYFDPNPQDGARMDVVNLGGSLDSLPLTIDGNGRTIEGSSTVSVTTPDEVLQWIYRADKSDWVLITPLASSGESPYPSIYDDLLAIGLAIRLASRYGKPLTAESQLTYSMLLKRFKAQYQQTIEKSTEVSMLRFSTDRYRAFSSDTRAFNLGR